MAGIGKQVRVSRTAALFTRGLGCALRDNLKLSITTHEHWELTLAEEKTKCGSPGECSWHGISDEFRAKLVERHGTGPWPECDRHYTGECNSTRLRTYHVAGQVGVPGSMVELRAVLIERHTDPFGSLFDVALWVRDNASTIWTYTFALSDDGVPYNWVALTPSDPPAAIAFGKPAVRQT